MWKCVPSVNDATYVGELTGATGRKEDLFGKIHSVEYTSPFVR